ncbi:hypothetical protein AAHK20_03670 [Trinickia sp. YCB016]
MADTAAPSISRSSRTATAKRRAGADSSDTENKLARAAKSAQRLAQLSDVTRDDSTGDLFGDDPAGADASRAALEAMNIDTRQGTLSGFELPDDVLLAVGMPVAERAETGGEAVASSKATAQAPAEAKASRPARRARPSENAASDNSLLADEAEATSVSTEVVAATVVQTVVPETPPQSSAASAETSAGPASALAPEPAPASAEPSAAPAQAKPLAREAAPYTPAASRRAPDLDWARATAFADTVDALYGVIADQRRAAGDHSRRMKWLLSTVVAALLVTIAIGITQTALLMRLTHESAAQQQRIEDMLRSQQATLTTLADAAASANARSAVSETATPSAPPAAPAPVTRQSPQAPAAAKHAKPQPHSHKPKAAPTY